MGGENGEVPCAWPILDPPMALDLRAMCSEQRFDIQSHQQVFGHVHRKVERRHCCTVSYLLCREWKRQSDRAEGVQRNVTHNFRRKSGVHTPGQQTMTQQLLWRLFLENTENHDKAGSNLWTHWVLRMIWTTPSSTMAVEILRFRLGIPNTFSVSPGSLIAMASIVAWGFLCWNFGGGFCRKQRRITSMYCLSKEPMSHVLDEVT